MKNDKWQKVLVENYTNNSGLVLKEQVETHYYYQWTGLMTGLFDIAKILWNKLSNGELQMDNIEKSEEYGQLFGVLRNIFNFLGEVNGYILYENSFFGKIIVSFYMELKDKNCNAIDTFRLKIEKYLARKIIIQNAMTRQMIAEEQDDRLLSRKMRSRVRKQRANQDISGDNGLKEEVKNNIEEKILYGYNDTLYVYKGFIVCHKNKHNVIQATALLHNQSDKEIALNVEYCIECKKFFLEYTAFEQYRERYGALIGNLRLITNGEFTGSYELAQESPLHIIGYNVGQKDNFTETERQYILARVLYGKIMTKGEVIKYLSFFIRRNGAKVGNELALSKWKADLAFVQEYDINIQPCAIISKVKKY